MDSLTKFTGCDHHRQRLVCLSNILTVAGLEKPCASCEPNMGRMREILHCEEVAPGLFLSASLSPEKKAIVEAAITARRGEENSAL